MSNYRHGLSFILSSILFALIGFSLLLLAEKIEKPKTLPKKAIHISIIQPKPKPKPIAPLIAPPLPKHQKSVKKIVKKRRNKRIKPRLKKVRKRIKKTKHIKHIKHSPKKVHKKVPKKIHRKVKKREHRKATPKRVHQQIQRRKDVIKREAPKRVKPISQKYYQPAPKPQITEPIIEEVTYYEYKPEPQPQRVTRRRREQISEPIVEHVYSQPVPRPPKVRQQHVVVPREPIRVDKTAEKEEFLGRVRSKIIANKEYPRMALRRHIQGSVRVKFTITSTGEVANLRYLSGKTILQKGARRAIEKSFPLNVPSNLKSELPIKDIYLTIHFNIN